MSHRAISLVSGGLIAALLAGCAVPISREREDMSDAAGRSLGLGGVKLPAEGCDILPAALRDQLVPTAKVDKSKQESFKTYSQELVCELSTDRDKSITTGVGRLRVRIERQLGEYGHTAAADTAKRHFATDSTTYKGSQPLPGVGDNAFLMVKSTSTTSKGYQVNVGVLRDVENVTIMFEAQPSTEARVTDTAKALATYVTDFLAGKQPESPTVAPFEGAQSKLPKATLKPDVAAVKIVGPTWLPTDQTYPMAMNDFPFAFRSPTSWNCFKDTKSPTGEGTSWTCGAPNSESSGPARMRVFVRSCPAGCPAETRNKLDDDWLTAKPTWTTFDATTTWAQTTEGGKYNVFLSHVFGDQAGAAVKWHVGVQGQAGSGETKQVEALQKVLNDIRSQTP